MAKARNSRSGKGGNQAGRKGKGPGGLPSKTGNRSGKGRDNVTSKKGK